MSASALPGGVDPARLAFGMPGEAVARGGVQEVLPPGRIASFILDRAS